MLAILLGVVAIGIGAKAFTPKGLPLTREKNLSGTTGKVVGVICILLGLVLVADGVSSTLSIVRSLSGDGP